MSITARGFQEAALTLVQALDNYAVVYRAEFETALADDYVLGDAWKDMHDGLKSMYGSTIGKYIDQPRFKQDMYKLLESAGFVTDVIRFRRPIATKRLIHENYQLALLGMLTGLELYITMFEDHTRTKRSLATSPHGIGWEQMANGFRGLLNGNLGPLDGGTLDGAILKLARRAGYGGDWA